MRHRLYRPERPSDRRSIVRHRRPARKTSRIDINLYIVSSAYSVWRSKNRTKLDHSALLQFFSVCPFSCAAFNTHRKFLDCELVHVFDPGCGVVVEEAASLSPSSLTGVWDVGGGVRTCAAAELSLLPEVRANGTDVATQGCFC
ncbi:hypothetical protein F2P81_023863 [Scophthalmus maximus]|uniref:Uncharacterized protein n=1 Tax=Scophthalmus maximus TaxID=52904 RepID=A0A6A4RMY6_SCOMX|nr:hypothetical protein F2P81_023863 [Scophthalmus maximus]